MKCSVTFYAHFFSTHSAHSFTSSWTDHRARLAARGSSGGVLGGVPLNPAAAGMASGVTGMPVNTSDLLEYPFITLKRFPPGFLHKIGGGFPIFFHLTTKETYVSFSFLGGLVSCRSVKLLEMEEDSETRERDNWWLEIRYGRKITENAVP